MFWFVFTLKESKIQIKFQSSVRLSAVSESWNHIACINFIIHPSTKESTWLLPCGHSYCIHKPRQRIPNLATQYENAAKMYLSEIKLLPNLATLPFLTTHVNNFGRITWTRRLTKFAFRHQRPDILAQPGSLNKQTLGCLWKARPFPEKRGAHKQQCQSFGTHCWCVCVCVG